MCQLSDTIFFSNRRFASWFFVMSGEVLVSPLCRSSPLTGGCFMRFPGCLSWLCKLAFSDSTRDSGKSLSFQRCFVVDAIWAVFARDKWPSICWTLFANPMYYSRNFFKDFSWFRFSTVFNCLDYLFLKLLKVEFVGLWITHTIYIYIYIYISICLFVFI